MPSDGTVYPEMSFSANEAYRILGRLHRKKRSAEDQPYADDEIVETDLRLQRATDPAIVEIPS